MSQINTSEESTVGTTAPTTWFWVATGIVTAVLAMLVTIFIGMLAQTPAGAGIGGAVNYLLGLDGTHATWFITRSAGFVAYFLLWLSTVWGLAVSSKILDRLLHRAYTFDFHEFLSLLAIGFLVLHVVVLLFDQYMPYSVAQLLVPFISPYRPLWIGIGVIAFYLTLLVSVTFYIRSRIGMRTFRVIHLASFVAYLGSVVHGLLSGTDTPLVMTQLMYASTFLVVVFLTVYWLIIARSPKDLAPVPPTKPRQPAPTMPQSPYAQPDRTGQPIQPGMLRLRRPPTSPTSPASGPTSQPPRV